MTTLMRRTVMQQINEIIDKAGLSRVELEIILLVRELQQFQGITITTLA